MVAAALAKRAKKFVHTSTTSVYGMQPQPFDETAPKLGKDVLNYQRSKTAAEEEVARGIAEGLDAVMLNPANVIGRYDWSTWSQFIRLAANRKLFRIPPGRACYADVNAVVRAHVAAVDKGRTGENYLLGGSRGLLCRDRANGGQTARAVDQYDSRPAGRVARSPAALWNASRRSPAGSR